MTGSALQLAWGDQANSDRQRQAEYVTMRVGNQLFGISVMAVQDVLRKQRIARVPLASAMIAGSLNIRGRIVTAIDMRVRLGQQRYQENEHWMNVVVELRHELYSLMVDSVGEVLSLSAAAVEKIPANVGDAWRNLSSGVYKLDRELLIVLDVDRVIHAEA